MLHPCAGLRDVLDWQAAAYLSILSPHMYLVLDGDLNIALETQRCMGREWSPATTDVLREVISDHSLMNIWHACHPNNTPCSLLSGWMNIRCTTPGVGQDLCLHSENHPSSYPWHQAGSLKQPPPCLCLGHSATQAPGASVLTL